MLVSLVFGLGLEHFCPWPQEGLSSVGLSLASDFFEVLDLGLEPCVLDSTSAMLQTFKIFWVEILKRFLHYEQRNSFFQATLLQCCN